MTRPLSIPSPPAAVIFDLDGTLVDSAPDLAAAANRLLASVGRPQLPLAAVHGMIGEGVTVLLERVLAATGGWPDEAEFQSMLGRFRADYQAHVADATRLFPGAAETVGQLRARGLKLALCTNKPAAPTHALLRALEVEDWFDAVVTGDGLKRKPHPQPVLNALAALGVEPHHTAYIGDSAIDLMAAHLAGVAVVLVTYGYTRTPAIELGAEATIDRLNELPALLGIAG